MKFLVKMVDATSLEGSVTILLYCFGRRIDNKAHMF